MFEVVSMSHGEEELDEGMSQSQVSVVLSLWFSYKQNVDDLLK